MPGFTVRIAKAKDLKAISSFATPIVKEMKFYNREHMARNLYEVSLKDLKETIKNYKDSIVIAVAKDGRIIGMCMHFFGFGHVDWLDWRLVSRDFRRNGVGRAMLKFQIQQARRHNCHKMWADCHPKNRPIIRFFRANGFRKVGVLRKDTFKQDRMLWEKIIA